MTEILFYWFVFKNHAHYTPFPSENKNTISVAGFRVNTEIMQSVIKGVGGAENINKVWHCMTRLRFDLADENKVAWDEIKNLPGVLGAQSQSGQVQIIVGPKVNIWYEAIISQLDPASKPTGNVSTNARKSLISMFMDTVSGVFGPIVPAIAGAGYSGAV